MNHKFGKFSLPVGVNLYSREGAGIQANGRLAQCADFRGFLIAEAAEKIRGVREDNP